MLAASQWRYPPMLALASLGGGWLLGFGVVMANTAVALVLSAPRRPAVVALSVAAAMCAAAVGPIWYATQHAPHTVENVRVGLVQPGVVHSGDQRLDAGIALTESLAATSPHGLDLVVWGESSVSVDLQSNPDVLARLTALSDRVGAPLLVNVDAPRPGRGIAKVAVLLDRTGVLGSYTKTRLVPFGEYVPFRAQLGWIAGHTQAAGKNRERGTGPVVLHTPAGLPIGPLVSFEATFPDMARTVAEDGARLIVYQTAMSTFQQSWAPDQMGSLGALRAAETGRPVANVLLTGTTAAYDVRGHRLAWLPSDRRGALAVTFATAQDRTLYDRIGNSVLVLCVLLVLPALPLRRLIALRPGARTRDRG
jgi:apolipoprotein N-acyltransferase